jgi:hypothetical protein
VLALLPASSALAATASDKKQNTRIKKLSKDLTAVKKSLGTLGSDVPGLQSKVDGIDGRLKGIEGAAPQIIQGLTDLKTNLEKAGVSIKTLATTQEYGIGQVFIGASPAAGSFVVTSDIPDAVQQASTTQQFIAGASGPISLQVAVRSGENDGTGASLPAAHCRVTIVDDAGGVTTSSPNPDLSNAPFWPIDQKSTLTSKDAANAGFPFGPKTSGPDADVLTNLTAGGNSSAAPNPPNTDAGADATLGEAYTVTLSCVDISPSADDLNA